MPPSAPPSRDPDHRGPSATTSARRTRRRTRAAKQSRRIAIALAAAAAVGAAFAPAHPTGNPVIDVIERAGFTAVVVLAASRSGRWTWLLLAAVAIVFGRGIWLVPAALAAAAALGGAWQLRHRRRLGALAAALGMQTVLRFPPVGFHGATAIAAAVATVPVLISGYRHFPAVIRRRTRRIAVGLAVAAVACSAAFGVAALIARAPLLHGVDQAKAALDQVGSSDPHAATAALDDATGAFHRAATALGAWWTAPAELVPIVGQHRRAIATTATVAEHVTSDAAASASQADYQQLKYQQGTIDLTRVGGLAAPLTRLSASLSRAATRLHGLDTGWLIGPVSAKLDTFETEISTVQPQTDLALQAVRVAPGLLGAHGPRHYFVAFTTPAEQRGLGGFIGSYGEILADHGHLTMTRSGPIADLNPAPGSPPRTLTGPPEYLARYGAFHPTQYFQDLTYSPDLPTVADVIGQLYPQAGGDHIDGVLVVDPYALAALLNFTGPITVAGLPEPLTPANAAQELLQGQYVQFPGSHAERKDALSAASRAVFDRLTSGNLPSPKDLADTLSPVVHRQHLGFYSFDHDEERFIRRLGLARSFPAPDGNDLLAVTTQNAANNKLDVYLQRTISDRIHVDPGTGQVASTVTVTLHNAAPATGLPDTVTDAALNHLPPGTNRTYLTIYTPLALKAASLDGTATSLTAAPELGWTAYATTISLAPGATATLTLNLGGELPHTSDYRLELPVQPAVHPDTVTVEATAADGWTVSQGGHDGDARIGPVTLDQPRTIELHLRRAN